MELRAREDGARVRYRTSLCRGDDCAESVRACVCVHASLNCELDLIELIHGGTQFIVLFASEITSIRSLSLAHSLTHILCIHLGWVAAIGPAFACAPPIVCESFACLCGRGCRPGL